MALEAGTRVGPYRIVSALGAGGMGEVYRARDPRLDREVAIKTLPLLSHLDADRVTRFEREAQILASLNHPHIARLYGLEEDGDARFLVLELVEGGTLAERLPKGPLPLPHVLTLARQVADALGAAHDKGIVHRDLKPANIGLSADGQVRVLDFGLAKTFTSASDDLLTTAAHSLPGAIVGTVAYMSPEQARGLPVDKRTDVWAFGCVLYELLAGRQPFQAATISDTIAAILNVEPDWSRLPASTPARLQWLVRRCLEKDATRRLHDIADARIEIEEMLAPGFSTASASTVVAPGPGARIGKRERIAWGLAALGVAAVAALAVSGNRAPSDLATSPALSSSILLPEGLRMWTLGSAGRFALSPDGRMLAMVLQEGNRPRQLWIRPLDTIAAQPLAGTEGAAFPFWSPDSKSIAFLADDKLKRISAAGGSVITLCDATSSSTGAWSRNDVILFTERPSAALSRIPASGGTPAPATTLDIENGDVQHWYPSFLPDGKHFLFFIVGSKTGGMTDARGIYAAELDSTAPPKLILQGGSNARFASGHLIFLKQGTLKAQPFDVDRLELTGVERPLAEQVIIAGAAATGSSGAFSVSDTGVLAYQVGSVTRSQLTWLDMDGKELSRIGEPADFADAVLSPDGSKAAVSIMDPSTGTRDLWTVDLTQNGLRERLTVDRSDDFAPVWSRDGRRLIYSSIRSHGIQLYERQPVPGGGERLVVEDSLGKFAADWSSNGQLLAYVAGGGIIGRSDLWIAPLTVGKPYAFAETRFIETQPRFSPDGQLLMFATNESAEFEVYAAPFPGPGARNESRRLEADGRGGAAIGSCSTSGRTACWSP